MSTRRLHRRQPESFAFSAENQEWVQGQIGKFPPGRQASAVIPLLFRAQEQEGWVSRPAIEEVARLLDMPSIRVLEVATFYFMFKLSPVGSVAHFEICGTTPCMLCGSEALVQICKRRIAPTPHTLSADGKFSWEEVECLGACANAPMAQIGKDYYEDLDALSFEAVIDAFAQGETPRPGSQYGRFASEPLGGRLSLMEHPETHAENASVALATGAMAPPRLIPGGVGGAPSHALEPAGAALGEQMAQADLSSAPAVSPPPAADEMARVRERGETIFEPKPEKALKEGEDPAPEHWRPSPTQDRTGGDDLKRIKGVGPQLEALLHRLGYRYFRQMASWTPENVQWVDQHLAGFRGRIERDEWVAQAKKFAEDGDER